MHLDYFEPVMGPTFVLDSRLEKKRGRTHFVLTRFLQGDELAVLPIRNAVLFPGAVAPFDVGREKSVALVEDVHNLDSPVIAIFVCSALSTGSPGIRRGMRKLTVTAMKTISSSCSVRLAK